MDLYHEAGLDQRTVARLQTSHQFVAQVFWDNSRQHTKGVQYVYIEYSDIAPGSCWNAFVDHVAHAGRILEDCVFYVLSTNPNGEIVSWYDLLEDASETYLAHLRDTKQWPDDRDHRELFLPVVRNHFIANDDGSDPDQEFIADGKVRNPK